MAHWPRGDEMGSTGCWEYCWSTEEDTPLSLRARACMLCLAQAPAALCLGSEDWDLCSGLAEHNSQTPGSSNHKLYWASERTGEQQGQNVHLAKKIVLVSPLCSSTGQAQRGGNCQQLLQAEGPPRCDKNPQRSSQTFISQALTRPIESLRPYTETASVITWAVSHWSVAIPPRPSD